MTDDRLIHPSLAVRIRPARIHEPRRPASEKGAP